MTTTGRLELVAFDAADIETLASFYADLAGWEVVRRTPDWITLRTGNDQEVAFQLAPGPRPPAVAGSGAAAAVPSRPAGRGPSEAAERAVRLGATRLADGASWITLADPSGHPFDLCQKDGVGPVMDLFAVTIDAPDASALAHFYADLLGLEVTYDGPEGALAAGDGTSLMFQQVSDYTPPQWPDPAHPQQGHLDILVDDLERGRGACPSTGRVGPARRRGVVPDIRRPGRPSVRPDPVALAAADARAPDARGARGLQSPIGGQDGDLSDVTRMA